MLIEPRKINVMGTEIRVEFRKEADDPMLDGMGGYYDSSVNLIVVKIAEDEKYSVKDADAVQRKTLRHEIIHAFLYESGLDWSSAPSDAWAVNEEMVDWFAIQSPKIFQVSREQGLI